MGKSLKKPLNNPDEQSLQTSEAQTENVKINSCETASLVITLPLCKSVQLSLEKIVQQEYLPAKIGFDAVEDERETSFFDASARPRRRPGWRKDERVAGLGDREIPSGGLACETDRLADESGPLRST